MQHDSRDGAVRARAAAVEALPTRNPRNEEDGVMRGDGLREHLLFLQSLLQTSFQPPTDRHRAQAALVRVEFERSMAAYRTFAATLPASR